jgi:hypothetical protein
MEPKIRVFSSKYLNFQIETNVQHCIALHCIALHCIALHCIGGFGLSVAFLIQPTG